MAAFLPLPPQKLNSNGRFSTHSFPSTPFPPERGENSNGRFLTPSSERGGTSIFYSGTTADEQFWKSVGCQA